ncbi:MAG: PadR family transcriptional regulator [Sporichthyaceae bacterium]|nr:PadR family transcriptional regulator [Sporichthyaceae bacterium]
MSAWFGHGRLRLYLLKLLADGPKHGYEVMRLMEDRTLGMYAPSAGTIYPRLARLEQEGLVTQTAGEGGRKVYALTDAGRAELARRESEVAELEQELRDNILGVADEIRGEVRESLRELRDQLKQSARQLKDERRRGRRDWQEWWQDWSMPPAPPPSPSAEAAAGASPGPAEPPGPPAAPAPPAPPEPPIAVPIQAPDGTSWPVGDLERELQRFTEQTRKIAYRAPIDAADVATVTAVLDDALVKLEAAFDQRGRR